MRKLQRLSMIMEISLVKEIEFDTPAPVAGLSLLRVLRNYGASAVSACSCADDQSVSRFSFNRRWFPAANEDGSDARWHILWHDLAGRRSLSGHHL